MSLQLAAQHLQSHGRGEDNQLVHMTTGELEALQKLAQAHGGSLTLNPHTGLPEAGFLSSLLPTVAGVALGAITGDPMLAAMMVGGADAAITGSLGQGLMAGLGAWGGASFGQSLSAVGQQATLNAGGNTATDLFNAAQQVGENGAQVASDAAINGQTLSPSGSILDSAGTQIAPNYGTVASNAAGAANAASAATPFAAAQSIITPQNFPNLSPDQLSNMQSQIASAGGNQEAIGNIVRAAGQANASLSSGAQGFDALKNGLFNDAGTGVGQSFSNAWNFAKTNPYSTLSVAIPVAGAISQAMKPNVPTGQVASNDSNPMHLKINPQWSGPTQPAQPNPYYTAQYTDYTKHPYVAPMTAAGGGLMAVQNYRSGGSTDDPQSVYDAMKAINEGVAMASPTKAEIPASHMAFHSSSHGPGIYQLSDANYAATTPTAIYKQYFPDPADKAAAQIAQKAPATDNSAKEGGLAFAHGGMAMGGIGSLGSFSDGGRLLKGPGDGVSDSIPASIGHKQPARLAEGEFVIPARIVSELGNGSTDAGAKRLYAMMDRVKAKRAKTKDIAADTKAYNYLPA